MAMNCETILKVLAVVIVIYLLTKPQQPKRPILSAHIRRRELDLPPLNRIRQETLGVNPNPNPNAYIRTTVEVPVPREAQGVFNVGHIRTNRNNSYMNSSAVMHHIRNDRRNNMLNSMMEGDGGADSGSSQQMGF